MKAALRIEIEKVKCPPFGNVFRWWILEFNRKIALSDAGFTTYKECFADTLKFKTGPDCIINGMEEWCLNSAIPIYRGKKKVG